MMTSVKQGVTRRKSMPAMPPGSSILTKDGNRNRLEVERSSSDRKRKVSFEHAEPVSNIGSPRSSVPQRRHSSTQAPNPSALTLRPAHPLASLSELASPLEERLTATDLIQACIKDAEEMHQPEPLPKASKDMDAILKDLQRLSHSEDLEDDGPDIIAIEVNNNLNSGEITSIKVNGCESTSAQQQQKRNVENKNHLPVKQEEKQLRLRKISNPVIKAPNINQLLREK